MRTMIPFTRSRSRTRTPARTSRLTSFAAAAVLLVASAGRSPAMISIGHLTPAQAAELGIAMKSRPNGDAGVKVWLEFEKKGFLENFTYAELRIEDEEGEHLVSARLEPHPVIHGQPAELVTVAFSADPDELAKCSFLVVAYGSSRGDVGYFLRVSEFLANEVGAGVGE